MMSSILYRSYFWITINSTVSSQFSFYFFLEITKTVLSRVNKLEYIISDCFSYSHSRYGFRKSSFFSVPPRIQLLAKRERDCFPRFPENVHPPLTYLKCKRCTFEENEQDTHEYIENNNNVLRALADAAQRKTRVRRTKRERRENSVDEHAFYSKATRFHIIELCVVYSLIILFH